MYEIHEFAAAVAERILQSGDAELHTESRLFQDMQELAVLAMEPEPGAAGMALRAH